MALCGVYFAIIDHLLGAFFLDCVANCVSVEYGPVSWYQSLLWELVNPPYSDRYQVAQRSTHLIVPISLSSADQLRIFSHLKKLVKLLRPQDSLRLVSKHTKALSHLAQSVNKLKFEGELILL